MSQIVIITEKPTVAVSYAEALGISDRKKGKGYLEGYSDFMKSDVKITWAIGHLVTICEPEEHNEEWKTWQKSTLPIIPQPVKYKIIPDKEQQMAVIKSLYTSKDTSKIYYAGDSGREGIYIQALIRNKIFGKKQPPIPELVVWIDSYTEKEIKRGIGAAKPYSEYQPMVNAGYARAILDWVLGMNFSRAETLMTGAKISVGRVMTPTLAMIVQRQREIESFKPVDYFGVKANLGGGTSAQWRVVKGSRYEKDPDAELLYNNTGFKNQSDAEALIAQLSRDMSLTVQDVTVTEMHEPAPNPFATSDILVFCAKHFGLKPDATAKLLQEKLYRPDSGGDSFITYPRTTADVLSTAVAEELKSEYGFDIPKRYINDEKIVDHHAIIPTFHREADELDGVERQVYDAIYNRFMDLMKPDFVYDSVKVTLKHSNGESFFYSFRIVKQLGWKSAYDVDVDDDSDEDEKSERSIPKKGSVLKVEAFALNAMRTEAPKPYTTATILVAMQKAGRLVDDKELKSQISSCGIGTPATRDSILAKLWTPDKNGNSFVRVEESKKKKKGGQVSEQKLFPTPLGCYAIDVISQSDERLISPVKTAEIEQQLENMVKGEYDIADFLTDNYDYIKETVAKMLSCKTLPSMPDEVAQKVGSKSGGATHNCPNCNAPLKFGKYGWYCGCGFNFYLEFFGCKMSESDLEDVIKTGKTKEKTFKKKDGSGTYKAMLVRDGTKMKLEFVNHSGEKKGSKGFWKR